MVMMKWTLDESGKPVSAWKTEATTTAQVKEFGARYHKAVRLTTGPHHAARRPLRTLALLAATVAVK